MNIRDESSMHCPVAVFLRWASGDICHLQQDMNFLLIFHRHLRHLWKFYNLMASKNISISFIIDHDITYLFIWSLFAASLSPRFSFGIESLHKTKQKRKKKILNRSPSRAQQPPAWHSPAHVNPLLRPPVLHRPRHSALSSTHATPRPPNSRPRSTAHTAET